VCSLLLARFLLDSDTRPHGEAATQVLTQLLLWNDALNAAAPSETVARVGIVDVLNLLLGSPFGCSLESIWSNTDAQKSVRTVLIAPPADATTQHRSILLKGGSTSPPTWPITAASLCLSSFSCFCSRFSLRPWARTNRSGRKSYRILSGGSPWMFLRRWRVNALAPGATQLAETPFSVEFFLPAAALNAACVSCYAATRSPNDVEDVHMLRLIMDAAEDNEVRGALTRQYFHVTKPTSSLERPCHVLKPTWWLSCCARGRTRTLWR
jgi:hypothetical protein